MSKTIKSSTKENDAVKRFSKHVMYEAADSVLKTFTYKYYLRD